MALYKTIIKKMRILNISRINKELNLFFRESNNLSVFEVYRFIKIKKSKTSVMQNIFLTDALISLYPDPYQQKIMSCNTISSAQ